VDIEESLYPWDKAHLVMVYDHIFLSVNNWAAYFNKNYFQFSEKKKSLDKNGHRAYQRTKLGEVVCFKRSEGGVDTDIWVKVLPWEML
jgi:hypothetical protein